MTLRRT